MKLAALLITLAVAVGIDAAAVTPAPCPDGFENFSLDASTPVCLMFAMYGKGTWENQRAMCQAFGADLAILEGNLHQQVVEYINDHEHMKDEGFWIGGSDAAQEGHFVWVDGTDMPMGTPHWYITQPNGGTAQNYVGLYTPDFFFHDLNNDKKIYSICQI